MQLASGLTCVLQNAVAGGGPNCIMQLCHQQVNKDVLSLFLLGMALCIAAVLGLTEVPKRLTRAVHRIQHYIIRVSPTGRIIHSILYSPTNLAIYAEVPASGNAFCASLPVGHLLSHLISLHTKAVSAFNILIHHCQVQNGGKFV